jgi:transposase InsO family protein
MAPICGPQEGWIYLTVVIDLYSRRQAAISDVREYVAVYFNSKRQHSTLGYRTPMNYEKDLNQVSGIC